MHKVFTLFDEDNSIKNIRRVAKEFGDNLTESFKKLSREQIQTEMGQCPLLIFAIITKTFP